MNSYGHDLAWIHHTGFGEFAESAGPGVLEILWKHGLREGLIVEMGCGSGILARELTRAGFDVLGFDTSPSMIPLARDTAPAARFEIGSFADAAIPMCSAIVAMGEVLNYGTLEGVRHFASHAARALPPGGVLLFDIAESSPHPAFEEQRVEGEEWSVITVQESDGKHLTRRVLTYRAAAGTMRRGEEVHALELYDRGEILALLRETGFRVRVRRSYGTRRLPAGHSVYVARVVGG